MHVCVHACVRVYVHVLEKRARGGGGGSRLPDSAALQGSCDSLWFFFRFSQLVSHHHMPFYYLENSLEFLSCVLLYEWNTNNIKFFSCGALVMYSAAAISSLFPCAGVGFFLSLARNGDLCLLMLEGCSGPGPAPSGFGDYWLRQTPPKVRIWFSFPQTLSFGNVLIRYIDSGRRFVALSCQGRCLSFGGKIWNLWNH